MAPAPSQLRTPWPTVYYHFRRFRLDGLWHIVLRALRAAERKRVGRDPEPSAAIVDSQSVKTTEESAHPSGYDPHKKVGGRKRHLLVDTMGLPLSICVTPANVRDQHGARLLLIGRKLLMPRLKKIWADGAYGLAWLKSWCKKEGSWELEIVERDLQSKGFKVLPRRWVVERTFGWLSRNRRLAKDYERRVQTSEILTRGSDDPSPVEAAREGSMNLTKHALITGYVSVQGLHLARRNILHLHEVTSGAQCLLVRPPCENRSIDRTLGKGFSLKFVCTIPQGYARSGRKRPISLPLSMRVNTTCWGAQ